MSKDNIHPIAACGFELGAEAYERGRPQYPQAAVDYLLSAMNVGQGSLLVDLAAGTGKFTRLLSQSKAKIIAVEPSEAMRRTFRAVLPEVELLPGRADAMPLPANTVDAITVAQAFHWFANSESLQEFHRLLKTNGHLGLIWNRRNEDASWMKEIGDLVDKHNSGAPQYKGGKWRKPFADSKLFNKLQSKCFAYEHLGSKETIFDRVSSISFIAAMQDSDRQKLLQQISTLLDKHPDTSGKSEFMIPYVTDIYWCQKLSDI